MKVVCVDDGPPLHGFPVQHPNGSVIAGDRYDVIETITGTGGTGYVIAGKPTFNNLGNGWGETTWHSRRFVPLDYYAAEFAVRETNPQPSTQPVCIQS